MVGIGVGLPAGLAALTSVITALTVSVGLSSMGWLVGLVCGVVLAVCVRLGLGRSGTTTLGPADVVTLVRATLACGVAALVADSFVTQPAVAAIVVLSVLALVLDVVDGWVARRTRTSSAFGARFDGEVDAFLILVLSVYVSHLVGAWVLAIGLARYAFAVAGWVWAWMRRPLPYRYWRKVTAGVQGVVMTLAAAEVVAQRVITAALLVALLLLAESFGRDVLWLWIRRRLLVGGRAHRSGTGRGAGFAARARPVKQDERTPFDRALQRARVAAYAPGEFVGQESFMRAGEILSLARRAGIGPGVSVLDLCCGVAGPGRHIAAELGCTYLGVDASPSAIELARDRAVGLPCSFEVAHVPPVPAGPFDVVLLLETLLAFADKEPLLRGVSAALRLGGRFALTVEEGEPLTALERERMPDADTVWLVHSRRTPPLAALCRQALKIAERMWPPASGNRCARKSRSSADRIDALRDHDCARCRSRSATPGSGKSTT